MSKTNKGVKSIQQSEENVDFRFVNIQIMSKNLFPLPFIEPSQSGFTFDVNAGLKVQPTQSLVIMDVTIKIFDIDNNYLYASFNIWCLFEVVDFENKIKKIAESNYDIRKY